MQDLKHVTDEELIAELLSRGVGENESKEKGWDYKFRITTYSGGWINYANPTPDQIKLKDIAHGLAIEPRYAGQSKIPLSVAEHSIYLAQRLPDHLAMWGMLHDAAEAYLKDLPSPLKDMLPGYKAIEHKFRCAIAEKFGLEMPIPDEVKQGDARMYATERLQICSNKGLKDLSWHHENKYEDLIILGLDWRQSEREYLRWFEVYYLRHKKNISAAV